MFHYYAYVPTYSKNRYFCRKFKLNKKKCFYFIGSNVISFPDDSMRLLKNSELTSATHSHFIPYNNVPMGATHYRGRLFITVPRRRTGVPSTLNYVFIKSTSGSSPSLRSYPSYKVNELPVSYTSKKNVFY